MISFFLLLPSLFADELFVTSRICPVFSEPSAASARIELLKQGDTVDIFEVSGAWFGIVIGAERKGWVQNLFVGNAPAGPKVSRASGMKNLTTVVDRRRASAYTTSAAAARGLSSENIRNRENLSFSDYDFASVEWIEQFQFENEIVLAFAGSEGIGY